MVDHDCFLDFVLVGSVHLWYGESFIWSVAIIFTVWWNWSLWISCLRVLVYLIDRWEWKVHNWNDQHIFFVLSVWEVAAFCWEYCLLEEPCTGLMYVFKLWNDWSQKFSSSIKKIKQQRKKEKKIRIALCFRGSLMCTLLVPHQIQVMKVKYINLVLHGFLI